MKILIVVLLLFTSSFPQFAIADAASDRFEVMQLVNRYAWAVDTLDKVAFERVFLPNASAHYVDVGDDAIDLDEQLEGVDNIYAWMVSSLGHRRGHDGLPWHFVSNQIVTLDGDRSSLTAYMHNRVLAVGGVYYIDAVRTDGGWRIKHLKLEAQTWNKDYYKQGPYSDFVD